MKKDVSSWSTRNDKWKIISGATDTRLSLWSQSVPRVPLSNECDGTSAGEKRRKRLTSSGNVLASASLGEEGAGRRELVHLLVVLDPMTYIYLNKAALVSPSFFNLNKKLLLKQHATKRIVLL